MYSFHHYLLFLGMEEKTGEGSGDLLKPTTSEPSAKARATNAAPANELEPNTAYRLYFIKHLAYFDTTTSSTYAQLLTAYLQLFAYHPQENG